MTREDILNKIEKYMDEQDFQVSFITNGERLNYNTLYTYGRKKDKYVVINCNIKVDENCEVHFKLSYITKDMLVLSLGNWYSNLFDEGRFNNLIINIGSKAILLKENEEQ